MLFRIFIFTMAFVCHEAFGKTDVRRIHTRCGYLIEEHVRNENNRQGYYVYKVESICAQIEQIKKTNAQLLGEGRLYPLWNNSALYRKENVILGERVVSEFLRCSGTSMFKGHTVFYGMSYLLKGDGTVLCQSIMTEVSLLNYCTAEQIVAIFTSVSRYVFSTPLMRDVNDGYLIQWTRLKAPEQ